MLQSCHPELDQEAMGDELPSDSEEELLAQMRKPSITFVSRTVLEAIVI